MAFGTRVGFEEIRSAAFGDVGVGYTALGGPLTGACRILRLVNRTNADILISYDGVTDQDVVPMQSFVLYDFTSDRVRDDGFFLAEGTVIWQKQASGAPSSGTLWGVVILASAGGV